MLGHLLASISTPTYSIFVQILEGCFSIKSRSSKQNIDKKLLEHHFVYACVWAFGGCLLSDSVSDDQQQFSKWWQTEHKAVVYPSEVTAILHLPHIIVVLTVKCIEMFQGTVFDYYVDESAVCMVHWKQRLCEPTQGV